MRRVIEGFSYKYDKKKDCRLIALQTALKVENINLSATDTLLYASAVTFRFFNAATSQKVPVMSIIGVKANFIESFAQNSGIKIQAYRGQNADEDSAIIEEAIINNHCVIVKADRYKLRFILQPKLVNKVTEKKHMTQHYFIIYGFDNEKKQYLICEPSSVNREFHHLWVDIDEVNKARKCKWIDFDIDNDLYIIENTVGYKPMDYKERLYVQLYDLCQNTDDSIQYLNEFVNQIHRCQDEVLKKYYVLLTRTLAMTILGFDLSGCFYRGFINEALRNSISDKKLLDMSKKNMENWCLIGNQSRKVSNIEDAYQVWCKILLLAENELKIWHKAISLL